jgi:hypothetical protein
VLLAEDDPQDQYGALTLFPVGRIISTYFAEGKRLPNQRSLYC